MGKSTLFNRLVGMRQAIVDQTAGVTRDRHYGTAEWCGREFSVIDTGGYTTNSDDIFEEEIRKQVSMAIEEADLILFLCEVNTGITDYDAEIADILRRIKKPVIPVVNKIDSGNQMYGTYEFHALGLGEPFAISAINGGGTGDLLDRICELLPQAQCRQKFHYKRISGRGAQYSDTHSRHHARLYLHTVQQIRLQVHACRYGRASQKGKSH